MACSWPAPGLLLPCSCPAPAPAHPSLATFFIISTLQLFFRTARATFFEPFWISRVFYFFLRTFEKVEPHPDPLGTSDETYAQSKFDISGSNETMQSALASIVYLWRIFRIFLMSQKFLCFLFDLGEICSGSWYWLTNKIENVWNSYG